MKYSKIVDSPIGHAFYPSLREKKDWGGNPDDAKYELSLAIEKTEKNTKIIEEIERVRSTLVKECFPTLKRGDKISLERAGEDFTLEDGRHFWKIRVQTKRAVRIVDRDPNIFLPPSAVESGDLVRVKLCFMAGEVKKNDMAFPARFCKPQLQAVQFIGKGELPTGITNQMAIDPFTEISESDLTGLCFEEIPF